MSVKKNNNYIFNSINIDNVNTEMKELKLIWSKNSSSSNKPLKSNKKNKKHRNRVNYKRKTIRSYRGYMNSNLWEERKNRYWREHGKMCKACGGRSFVTLHHMVYSGIYGQEPDTEVIALCGSCHKQFHDNYKLRKNMVNDTYKFIKEVQENRQLYIDSEQLDIIFKHLS